MGGFFGATSRRNCILDVFFGTDYHSHLGTRRGGMAAHLAGAIAANTTIPVIGIPCKSTNLDGIDALLSTVQMPSGIPVATVAINGAVNAALLAAQIIAVSDEALAAKLDAKRASDAAKVLEKDAALQAELSK